MKNGFNIFCNGGKNVSPLSTVKHYRMFKCTHARLYTNDIISRQSQEYRKVSYSYDRRNNRSQGKSMPRRSNTCRPCSKDAICPFSFQVSFNSSGFYVVNGKGNNLHIAHPHVTTEAHIFPPRLLNEAEKKVASSVIHADATHGVVRNVINHRNGLCLTTDNCAYLASMQSNL